jgi:hypothetical protein
VKAFKTIYVSHLATLPRPTGDPERSMLPIAGNDEAAKQSANEFLDSIGYNAFDVGPLSGGWRYRRATAAYVQPYTAPGSEYPTWPGRQVPPEMLKKKLDAAVRYGTCRALLRMLRVPQADPLPVVRTKNAHWHVRQLIVESTLVGDAQQPDGQCDTCREE